MSLYDKMHKKFYEVYQLEWMKSHGLGLPALLNELSAIVKKADDANLSPLMAFQEFEGAGFNGQLWSCFDEFMQNDYQNDAFIKTILNTLPFSDYWYLIYQREKSEKARNPEDYYEKDALAPLNFIECMQLLDALIVNELLMLDMRKPHNIIVYQQTGDENHPEGWYSRNIHEVASELVTEEIEQRFLRDTLEENGIQLKFVRYMN